MSTRAIPAPKRRGTATESPDPRERTLADLRDELSRHPVPLVHSLADDLDWLSRLERERGGDCDWLGNAVERTRTLLAVANLAELGRQKLYTAEQHRSRQRLEAQLEDERLVPEVERLVAAREPVKVIQQRLGLSKERVVRIKRLAAAQAYRARFPRRG